MYLGKIEKNKEKPVRMSENPVKNRNVYAQTSTAPM
jgi:hypothetical protein